MEGEWRREDGGGRTEDGGGRAGEEGGEEAGGRQRKWEEQGRGRPEGARTEEPPLPPYARRTSHSARPPLYAPPLALLLTPAPARPWSSRTTSKIMC